MTPENQLKAVMAQLKAAEVEPVTVYSTDSDARIRVKVRNQQDLARLLGLGFGWDLSVVVEAWPA